MKNSRKTKALLYMANNDKEVFSIMPNGQIRYISNGKLRLVKVDKDLVRAVKAMISEWNLINNLKYTTYRNE